MSDRVVWFDLPVGDLERACKFYGAVLEHTGGNGGCLVPGKASADGVLVYMNVDGRHGKGHEYWTAWLPRGNCRQRRQPRSATFQHG